MIINTSTLETIFVNFDKSFQIGFDGAPDDWKKIAMLVRSTGKSNLYGWLKRFPKMREWLGDRIFHDLEAQDYTITNRKFEMSFKVDRDEIEDDTVGALEPYMAEMGRSAGNHPNEMIYKLVQDGFSTECYDGQYFFDTDHPVGSGTASNDGGGSGNAWMLLDTSRPLKPFIFQKRRDYNFKAFENPKDENVFMRDEFKYGVDARVNAGYGLWQLAYGSKDTLNQTNYDTALEAMMAFTDDDGRPLNIKPNLLVCGPSNRKQALTVLKAEYDASGASNVNFKSMDLLITPHMEASY
jgi:phage major head subunit gpT-like protein